MLAGGETKARNPFAKKTPPVAKNPFVPDTGNSAFGANRGSQGVHSGLMATKDVIDSLNIDGLEEDEPEYPSS
jgi:hypothetical protein